MRGLHVVADFYDVPENPLLTDAALLRAACVSACTQAGLTVVGERFHQFSNADGSGQAGATGAVILAASHLAIHTWPERAQVTLDIYLCEFEDGSQWANEARAEAVFAHITGLLRPMRAETQRIIRGGGAETQRIIRGGGAETQRIIRGGGAETQCSDRGKQADTTA